MKATFKKHTVRLAAALLAATAALGGLSLRVAAAEQRTTAPSIAANGAETASISADAASSSARSGTSTAWIHVERPDITLRGLRYGGEVYVPLYLLADTLGGTEYGWSFADGCAYVDADGLYLTAVPGQLYITANDRCFFTSQPILDPDGVVHVPAEALAAAFGLEVVYGSWGCCLYGSGYDYCQPASEIYYGDEVYWLSRIIHAEAGGEPFLGKVAVGNVVLNRVDSPAYPNCIWGVIFDRRHGTQFTPAATGTVYCTPSPDSIAAAKVCLEGYSLSREILYFLNPRIATSFWIVNNCTPVMSIGNHDFYS